MNPRHRLRGTGSLFPVLGAAAFVLLGAIRTQAQPPTIQNLNIVPGATIFGPSALSSDGSVVVGVSGPSAFRWTPSSGVVTLGGLPSFPQSSSASGVSGDGELVVGLALVPDISPNPPTPVSVRWTPQGVISTLPPVPGAVSPRCRGLSGNGSVIVGEGGELFYPPMYPEGFGRVRAVRWVDGAGQVLPLPAGAWQSWAVAADRTGSHVVGYSSHATNPPHDPNDTTRATRWTNGAPEDLADFPTWRTSIATAVNGNGNVVAGVGQTTQSVGVNRPFRWTPASGMTELPLPPGALSGQAASVSGSGALIGGEYLVPGGRRAFLWTLELGTVDLLDHLASRGFDVTGWVLESVSAISESGVVLVGVGRQNGNASGWRVKLDVDRDGDGLEDEWETLGIPYEKADGTTGRYLLPGANPLRKDIFVEVDAMPGRMPPAAAMNMVIAAFDQSPVPPVSGVAGSVGGITLHVLRDEEDIPVRDYETDDGWPEFKQDKAQKFGSSAERTGNPADWPEIRLAKAKAFRYCIFCKSIPFVLGLAEVDLDAPAQGPRMGGNDFMIGLDRLPPAELTPATQAGVFMHELGHTLGLFHGGAGHSNFRPNHFSVMNYLWTAPRGFAQAGNPGFMRLSYSTSALATLNEAQLDETLGIGGHDPTIKVPIIVRKPASAEPAPCTDTGLNPNGRCEIDHSARVPLTCINYVPFAGQVDWNNDGLFTTEVCADPNHFGGDIAGGPGEVLDGCNEWALLAYNFRESADYSDFSIPTDIPRCPTPEIEMFLRSIPPPAPGPCPAPPPTITDPAPMLASACSSGGATFTATPQGAGPFVMRWRRWVNSPAPGWMNLVDGVMPHGTVVQGSDEYTLRLTNANENDLGAGPVRLSCTAIDSCDQTAASAESLLSYTTLVGPGSAQEVVTCPGQSASFVAATQGAGTFGYQWLRYDSSSDDFVPMSNGPLPLGTIVQGATAATLTLSNLRAEDLSGPTVALACRASGPCASPSLVFFTLRIGGAFINTGPTTIDLPCSGTAQAVFTVSALGDAPISYLWSRDGVPLVEGGRFTGTNAPALTIALPLGSDAGNYTCEALNACGSSVSSTAVLNVGAPQVRTQPASSSVCPGAAIILDGSAIGTQPLTFRWLKGGTELNDGGRFSGVHTTQLIIQDAQSSDAGDYRLRVVNTCDTALSDIATISLAQPVGFTSNPANRTTCPGGSVVLSASPNQAPLVTLWQAEQPNLPGEWEFITNGPLFIDGHPCATAAGADTPTLTLNWSTQPLCRGTVRFRCVAASACEAAYGEPATVRICRADFDCSGVVSVSDIFSFLSAWFTGSPAADVDGNGTTVADIFTFLGSWFSGC